MAQGVNGTEAYARIDATRILTRFVGGTVRVLYTLGPAARVWVTEIVSHAFTRGGTGAFGAHSIRTARRRMAQVWGNVGS